MKTNIKTSGISLTPSISEYTEKRLNKISNLLSVDPTTVCDVELAKTTDHHNKGNIFKAEIHIVGINKNIYAKSEQEDLYAAIDIVRDDVLRQLKDGKEKQISFMRRGGAKMKDMVKGLWPWGKRRNV